MSASLIDLDSVMKAAELEALQMEDRPIPEEVPIPEIPISQDINSTTINSALNQLTGNPDEMSRLMQESIKHMSPETMQQARNLAMGNQGEQIKREMQKRGIDPHAMRKKILKQKRALRGTVPKSIETTLTAILITESRQVKLKQISPSSLSINIGSILKGEKPVELSCSRLAQGPLANKSIKIWYNPNHPGRNKRTSKIIGFPVGGSMLIVAEGEDLSEKEFLAAEKFLA